MEFVNSYSGNGLLSHDNKQLPKSISIWKTLGVFFVSIALRVFLCSLIEFSGATNLLSEKTARLINMTSVIRWNMWIHDDVIKWKHFPRYWPFVRGIHRSRWIPRTQRTLTRRFDISFDLRPNKRLSKQPWGWWFEMSSWSLWRQCDVKILHWSGSTSALVMACSLKAPRYNLSQCWLIVSKVPWHSPEVNFTRNAFNYYNWIEGYLFPGTKKWPIFVWPYDLQNRWF